MSARCPTCHSSDVFSAWDTLLAAAELLPPLPIMPVKRGVQVGERSFTAWDTMQPWGLTAIAFVQDDSGTLSAWTPDQENYGGSGWRIGLPISKECAWLLSIWLHGVGAAETAKADISIPSELQFDRYVLFIRSTDPDREIVLGFANLEKAGFEASLVHAGLRRGGVVIQPERARELGNWLAG